MFIRSIHCIVGVISVAVSCFAWAQVGEPVGEPVDAPPVLSIEIPESVAATVAAAAARFQARENAHAIALADIAITRIESTDRYDARMVEPFTTIGDAALQLGDLDRALDAYQRGMQLLRMSQGLLSADQLPLIYRQADIHVARGDRAGANQLYEYAFQVMHRGSPPTEEMLAAAFQLGRWYERMDLPFAARALYERLAESLPPEADPRASALTGARLELLLRLARTYRLVRFPLSQRPVDEDRLEPRPYGVRLGESGSYAQTGVNPTIGGRGYRLLEEAVALAQAAFGNNAAETLLAELELADWLLLFGDVSRARPRYADIYRRAERHVEIRTLLAQPFLLSTTNPGNPRRLFGRPKGEQGSVVYRFGVSTSGWARQLELVARDPEDFDDIRYRRTIERMRFRPAMVDGGWVRSSWEQSYRFTY